MIPLLEPPASRKGASPGGEAPVVSSSGARNAGGRQVESREAGERAGGRAPGDGLAMPGRRGGRRRRQQRDRGGQPDVLFGVMTTHGRGGSRLIVVAARARRGGAL